MCFKTKDTCKGEGHTGDIGWVWYCEQRHAPDGPGKPPLWQTSAAAHTLAAFQCKQEDSGIYLSNTMLFQCCYKCIQF